MVKAQINTMGLKLQCPKCKKENFINSPYEVKFGNITCQNVACGIIIDWVLEVPRRFKSTRTSTQCLGSTTPCVEVLDEYGEVVFSENWIQDIVTNDDVTIRPTPQYYGECRCSCHSEPEEE